MLQIGNTAGQAAGVLVALGVVIVTPVPGRHIVRAMSVEPASIVPFVFHGWFLVGAFLFAVLTGFGREQR